MIPCVELESSYLVLPSSSFRTPRVFKFNEKSFMNKAPECDRDLFVEDVEEEEGVGSEEMGGDEADGNEKRILVEERERCVDLVFEKVQEQRNKNLDRLRRRIFRSRFR